MKKNILILACLITVMVSCQKDDFTADSKQNVSSTEKTAGSNNVEKTSFVKKVLVEEFVGITYGDAPEFTRVMKNCIASNPNKIIVASHHNNDFMESCQTDALVNALSGSGVISYPSSLVDRANHNGCRFTGCSSATNVISQQLIQSAICGISISSTINSNKAIVDVAEAFAAPANGTCNLTVYMVEDKINPLGFSNRQANNFNNDSKSIFFHLGNPMAEYAHLNVVRACITPSMGLPLSSAVSAGGGMGHHTFTIEMPSYINKDNCYFIAFISKSNNGVSTDVLNAQMAKLGSSVTMN